MKQSTQSFFGVGTRPPFHETVIFSLVNQYYCVPKDLKVRELSDELKRVPEVWAVGVVNGDGEALGIIVTSDFQERMSRPYAHEVFDKKPVADMMTKTKSFPFSKNIISVSEELADEVRSTTNHYYLVEDAQGRFSGIFSTKDLLIHQFSAHREDIELAVSIQRAVVPEETLVQRDAFEAFASSNMAKGVGGDFLAVKEVAPGRWLWAVCDVSGKGVAASLVTAALGGMFAQYDVEAGLSGFVEAVNAYILSTFQMEKYLTGVFLEFDEQTKVVKVCDMGHSYVGIVREGTILKSPPLNPFVGFVPNLSVTSQEWTLQTGDLLFAYTDGYVEQKNIQGEEFGIETFEAALTKGAHHALPDLASSLHKLVKKFRGDQPRGDDEAILLVRVS